MALDEARTILPPAQHSLGATGPCWSLGAAVRAGVLRTDPLDTLPRVVYAAAMRSTVTRPILRLKGNSIGLFAGHYHVEDQLPWILLQP